MSDTILKVSKIDAARRQLRTAINLWFTGGDPVSVHALVFAAYEIFHYVSKHRDPYRRDLIFDTDYIKDEHIGDWNKIIRKNANFFKHADRDPNDITELDPAMNEWFILYAILGRRICGESQSEEESDFMWWYSIHRTKYLTEAGRKTFADVVPVHVAEFGRKLPKEKFYELLRQSKIVREGGQPDFSRVLPLDVS